jgi:hypothetical protein
LQSLSTQLNNEHCGSLAKRENENIVVPDEIAAVCLAVFIRIVEEAIGHTCCHIIACGTAAGVQLSFAGRVEAEHEAALAFWIPDRPFRTRITSLSYRHRGGAADIRHTIRVRCDPRYSGAAF